MAARSGNLERFNERWGKAGDLKPFFIVIGGAAGVGKSSLAACLREQIPALIPISTSIIQTVLRATQAGIPWLEYHTYDLDSIEHYLERCRPIMDCTNLLSKFASTERQLYAIEGSSIVPSQLATSVEVNTIELYMRVTDPALHRAMLGGETHDRTLTEAQFRRCRAIQDFIGDEAERLGRIYVEFDDGLRTALRLIDEALEA